MEVGGESPSSDSSESLVACVAPPLTDVYRRGVATHVAMHQHEYVPSMLCYAVAN